MNENLSIESIREYARQTEMHKKIRDKFLREFKAAGAESNSVLFLKGGEEVTLWDTDNCYSFRQESFFFYLFGVEDPDCVGMLEVDSGKVHLFVPRLDKNLALYLVLPTPELIASKYGYEAHYIDELPSVLSSISPSKIYLNKGKNTDSGSSTVSYFYSEAFSAYSVDENLLYPSLAEARVIKTPEEIEVLKRMSLSGSEAHVRLMQSCKPGMMEYQLPAAFHSFLANLGLTHSFPPISASGSNGSTLHYPDNSKRMNESELVICDMGSYGYGYCSDITCTLPVSGVFSEKQRGIYELVLKANREVTKAMRPGVNWTDMHLLAERIILEGLKELGLVQGDVDQMIEKRVGGVFMPHGLGHFLGMDVHDVGGYVKGPEKIDKLGLRNLRTRRDLEENMVITVEPGCYFIDFAIDEALQNPETQNFLVKEKIDEYRGFGGVRLEDDVLVTSEGAMVLNDVPRTPEQVQAAMQGANWK